MESNFSVHKSPLEQKQTPSNKTNKISLKQLFKNQNRTFFKLLK